MRKTRTLAVAAVVLVLVAWFSCSSNHAPDVPAVPTGPDYCIKDTTYTFGTVVSDPDGDSIAVRFDWGDSTTTYWVGWFASGDTVALTHAWSDTGNFEVRVLAQDKRLLTSDSSEGHKVLVALRRPPDAPVEPSGPDSGRQDSSYEFQTSASHPDSMFVAIRFAWGDGDTSDWTSFWYQNAPVQMEHAWSAPGTFAVTAQAKDTGDALSQWSVPCSIVIRPPDTLRKWRVRLVRGQYANPSSPAIAPDGTIYVGSPDSALYAIEPSGAVKWRFAAGGLIQSSPAIAADGTVYVGSNDSCLYAVNPDGTLRWKYVTGGIVQSSPAVAADGTVYFGSTDDYLCALNPDGSFKWRDSVAGAGTSSPAIAADGTVYLGTDASSIYALNPDGTFKWRHDSGAKISDAGVAIGSDGTIYCGTYESFEFEGGLSALNPDGSLRWASPTYGGRPTSPAIAVDGTIYVASARGWWNGPGLCALSPDGTTRWNFWCDEEIGYPHPEGIGGSSPAVCAYGTIYFGSYGSFYALYPDGTLKWRYKTGARVESSPTIGSDGTVYFTCDDGYLYALKGTGPLANSPWPKFHHDLQNTGRTDQGSWSQLRTVGAAQVTPDSKAFLIRVANVGTVEASVSSLAFSDTSVSLYMRDFYIATDHCGYPLTPGIPGTGPGDTVHFTTPVTVAPNASQLVELYFADFHSDSLGVDTAISVPGKTFRFRFSDGSVITVNP